MHVISRARDLWPRFVAPGQWTWRRVVGESLLAAVMALLAGALEHTSGHGPFLTALFAVATPVLSLARRVLPATSLIGVAALTGATQAGLLPLLAVVAWSAGRRIEGALRALAAWAAAFIAFEALVLRDQPPLSFVGLFLVLLFLFTTAVPGLAGRYWSQRRALLDTLRERNAQLLRERRMVAGQARLRERQRIAQDMHDSLGHQLALIAVQTGALEVSHGLSEQQREAVGVLRQASVAAMHELRAVVGVLKDGTPEDERPGGVAGIDGLVEAAETAGTPVRLVRSGEPRPLGAAADHAAYRVVQEGLTNAFKHAPGAELTVGLHHEADALVVEVVNGPAPGGAARRPAAVSGGQGLTGLRERARLAGGMVYAGSLEDGGFRLAGLLPYHPSPEAAEAGAPDSDDTWPSPDDVVEAGVAGIDPREEFKSLVGVTRSRGCLAGCGVGVLIVFGLAALLVIGAVAFFDALDKSQVEPGTYRDIKVGSPESEVRDRLPSGKSFLTSGLDRKGPAEPAGARCLSLLSTDSPKDLDKDRVYRFCFRDGKLIEKREFVVKGDE
ncbi:sensor histidine kinase [Streptomyces huiliensis]|uniref:sensor histidine kinase n=1 Tax=Streptomyces huiliensis TaxID=2876027 RepID=UPI001CBDBC36|nr:histidine kinase [Streptomyces huiliensis]MBZ4322260.1 sensor histidine kinase [Streptomyces huiliensis]